MSRKKRELISQSVVQLTMFVTIPITVLFLNVQERTLWLVFFTISTLNPIFLLGFESSIARISSFIAGGATTIKSEGLSDMEFGFNVDRLLFSHFTNSLRSIFLRLSISVSIIVTLAGILYFISMDLGIKSLSYVLFSWSIFTLSLLINNVQIYRDAVIRGFDRQESVNVALILSRLTFLSLSLFSITVLQAGLLGLVVSHLISTLQLRLAISKQWQNLRSELEIEDRDYFGDFSFAFGILWKNSVRVALVFVGSFLTLRSGILFAPYVSSLEFSSNFILISTLVLGAAGVSTELAKIYLPTLHLMQMKRIDQDVLKVFGRMLSIAWVSYISAIISLIIFWRFAHTSNIENWSNNSLLICFLIGLVNFFELTNSIYTMFISSGNTVPHMPASLLTGAMNLLLLFFLGNRLSLVGIVVIQASSGFLWNYWGWIHKVSVQFQAPPWRIFMLGLDFGKTKKSGLT